VTYIRDEKTGRFLVGNNGAAGRPKGARNKLAEAFIDDIYQDWKQHGIQVIREVRETSRGIILRFVQFLFAVPLSLTLYQKLCTAMPLLNLLRRGVYLHKL
jgi:hypothetical protein